MKRLHLTTILITLIIMLSTGLLLENRFNIESHEKAWLYTNVKPREFSRGEIISTMPNSELIKSFFVHRDSGPRWSHFETPLQLHLADTIIYVDENTEVKIVDGREGQLKINVIQGRVLVKGDLTIQTREVLTKTKGQTSFVHYSWLDEIEVAFLNTDEAYKMSTLPPYERLEITFDPVSSTAAKFYSEVENLTTVQTQVKNGIEQ